MRELLERLSSGIRHLRDVPASVVKKSEKVADSSGKQGFRSSGDPHFASLDKQVSKHDEWSLVDVSIGLLDTSAVDSKESESLIREYVKMGGKGAPPLRIGFSKRSAKMGKRTIFVANGNHRVEAAKRRGEAMIRAYIPKEDYLRFIDSTG